MTENQQFGYLSIVSLILSLLSEWFFRNVSQINKLARNKTVATHYGLFHHLFMNHRKVTHVYAKWFKACLMCSTVSTCTTYLSTYKQGFVIPSMVIPILKIVLLLHTYLLNRSSTSKWWFKEEKLLIASLIWESLLIWHKSFDGMPYFQKDSLTYEWSEIEAMTWLKIKSLI